MIRASSCGENGITVVLSVLIMFLAVDMCDDNTPLIDSPLHKLAAALEI